MLNLEWGFGTEKQFSGQNDHFWEGPLAIRDSEDA